MEHGETHITNSWSTTHDPQPKHNQTQISNRRSEARERKEVSTDQAQSNQKTIFYVYFST